MTAPSAAYYEILEERLPGHGLNVADIQSRGILVDGSSGDGAPTGEGFRREAKENSQWPENDLSLNGDVSMGDSLGSLIVIKPKPVAS